MIVAKNVIKKIQIFIQTKIQRALRTLLVLYKNNFRNKEVEEEKKNFVIQIKQ